MTLDRQLLKEREVYIIYNTMIRLKGGYYIITGSLLKKKNNNHRRRRLSLSLSLQPLII